jgi:ferritin-like metal-binding protein YciE
MGEAERTILRYLNEAHATERALIRVLQSQIALAPPGPHRDGLEAHLRETRDHAERVERRLGVLDQGLHPIELGVGLAQSLIAQAISLAKAPFDLARGEGRDEKVLKNAKDACAAEALEIASYTAIERLANSIADTTTERLAASIRADEERMLARLNEEIPALADAVAGVRVRDEPAYRQAVAAEREQARSAPSKARPPRAGAKRRPRRAPAQGRSGHTSSMSPPAPPRSPLQG